MSIKPLAAPAAAAQKTGCAWSPASSACSGVWLQLGSPRLWGKLLSNLGPEISVHGGSCWMLAQWQQRKEVSFLLDRNSEIQV